MESFQGLRVLALESRRAQEIAKLIRTYGGEPTVVPAMREVSLESNREALDFTARLLKSEFDLVIFLTGIGIRRLMEIAESRYDREQVLEALRKVKIASRGPKPNSVLKELGLPVTVNASEPSTWHEMIRALDESFGASLRGLRVAVQEYGAPNPELLQALTARGVQWTSVPVYHWALPDDLAPLKGAVQAIVSGEIDIVVFLTAVQAIHLFRVAETMGQAEALRNGFRRTLVLSIGPSTSEELHRLGIPPDFEPSHPKMGFLVNEAAGRAVVLLKEKRASASQTFS